MRFFFLDGSALANRYVPEPGAPLLDQFATDAIVLHAALGLAEHRDEAVATTSSWSPPTSVFSVPPRPKGWARSIPKSRIRRHWPCS